jgi:hypothetical protein
MVDIAFLQRGERGRRDRGLQDQGEGVTATHVNKAYCDDPGRGGHHGVGPLAEFP